MEKVFLAALFLCTILAVMLWGLFGLLLLPVFRRSMVTLLFTRDQGAELEQAVRAFGWLRGEKKDGGTLLLVDCGLDTQGLELAQRIRDRYLWVCLCPRAALEDCLEFLEVSI